MTVWVGNQSYTHVFGFHLKGTITFSQAKKNYEGLKHESMDLQITWEIRYSF